MKQKLLFVFVVILLQQFSFAQLVYRNGNIGTGTLTSSGVAAAVGREWSEAQAISGVANTNAGSTCIYNNALTSNFRIADNFVVPVSQQWVVSQISVYAYQTGATAAPFDVLRLQIWNGIPGEVGSTVVFGDLTTNRLSSTTDTLRNRVFNTSTPAPGTTPGTTRIIWSLNATITGLTLNPGTYWLDWQAHATNDGSAFAPPINVVGVRGLVGWDARQFNGNAVSPTPNWAAIADGGNPATVPTVPQDMPFAISYNNTMPVTFGSFSGTKFSGRNELKWNTVSETNNKGFYIERSFDGIDFKSIGFISSKANNGNATSSLNYEFNDFTPSTGTNYYRLKQTDKDGKFTYSSVVTLKGNKLVGATISAIYPNPVKDNLTITIGSATAEKASLVITDLSGKIVRQKNISLTNGEISIFENISNFATGTYLLKLVDEKGATIETKKIVKQ